MKHPLWSAAYALFQDVDTFVTTGNMPGADAIAQARLRAASEKDREKEREKKAGASVRGIGGIMRAFAGTDDLVDVRGAVRAKLDLLKANLTRTLTERESYLVLFPIVVYCDEVIQNRLLSGPEMVWPPLQKELFKIDNGGEVFYDTLDDLLRKPETLPFIYEVFYYCLAAGFTGKHANNLAKINEYKSKLEAKIPVALPPKPQEAAEAEDVVSLETLPVWSWVGAAVFLATVFGALHLLAG